MNGLEKIRPSIDEWIKIKCGIFTQLNIIQPKKRKEILIHAIALMKLRKGMKLPVKGMKIKEGETSPPKRYNSGSMILAMENAGQLIEDEDLRSQIKGSGIGTSATRAGILTKLVDNKYIALQKKTQVLSPTKLGEYIAYYVKISVPHLLNPKLTASWEMGLSEVADGTITEAEYMEKLEDFVRSRTEKIRAL